MQPDDRERQDEIDEEWEREHEARVLAQQERLEAEQFTAEDRRLMDNPGLHWTQKPKFVRGVDDLLPNHSFGRVPPQPRYRPKKGEPAWDEGQWHEATADTGVIVKITETPEAKPRVDLFETQAPNTRTSGLYLCRICRQSPALWPREKALRWSFWGTQLTWTFRSPIACTYCRFFEFKRVRDMGRQDHRPFWNKVFGWTNGLRPEALQRRAKRKILGWFVLGGKQWRF